MRLIRTWFCSICLLAPSTSAAERVSWPLFAPLATCAFCRIVAAVLCASLIRFVRMSLSAWYFERPARYCAWVICPARSWLPSFRASAVASSATCWESWAEDRKASASALACWIASLNCASVLARRIHPASSVWQV